MYASVAGCCTSAVPTARPSRVTSVSAISTPHMLRAFAATTARPLAKAAHARGMAIAVGSKFPSVDVDAASWPPTAFNLADRIANKKVRETRTFTRARPCLSPRPRRACASLCHTQVIVCGLPGAFTPT